MFVLTGKQVLKALSYLHSEGVIHRGKQTDILKLDGI
jgi:hypothetical protein